MPGADDLLIAARSALLDALDALSAHREAIVLVGAQAIYLYTGDADVPIATTTKDSDLVIDPGLIGDDPLLEDAMSAAGFHRNLESGQPGEWLDDQGIPVDLLVPETLVPAAGRRGARITPHSSSATRKVLGLEAAVVDNRELEIRSLRPGDARTYRVRVAGPAALLVAKLHKLGERRQTPHRLVDKDAHDLYRLLRRIETDELVDGFARLLADDRSRAVTTAGLVDLRELFLQPTSLGAVMAGRVEEGVGDPEAVAAAVAALASDLLETLERSNRPASGRRSD
jgi:hypothetical protein